MRKIKAVITTKYEVDISDFHDEGETTKHMVKRVKDELHDISVFSQHCDYGTLKDVKVEVTKATV